MGLEKCAGKFMVGYTDLHGSLDCVADWRDQQRLCIDIMDSPEKVHAMLGIANENFLPVLRPLRRSSKGPWPALRHLDGDSLARQNAHSQLAILPR